jgi:hypothetical protein
MSQKYSLTDVLGVWLIFSSIIPWLSTFSIFSAVILGHPLDLTYFNYWNIFLLCSPYIMTLLGWGLIKKYSWARNGLIFYMLLNIILSAFQYPFIGFSPYGITINIIIIGVLLYSNNRISLKEEPKSSTNQPPGFDPI